MNEQGVTIKNLAARTGINQSSITSFLTGSRAISNANLDLILNALGLTLVPKKGFTYVRTEEADGE